MKVHEYQAKEILRKFGVAVPAGKVAFSVEEAVSAAYGLGGSIWVVKAQIHAGGRGKGGGVTVARTLEEVRQTAGKMLGMRLVTHQTGPEGKIVKRLLIEQGIAIARELYVGVTCESIVVEIHLRVEGEDLPLRGKDERVDLRERTIHRLVGSVERRE
ncbi:MAG TPA: ATP-grasp domain-containing protein, partial [Bacteroidota bacterium]|nr:ATP-grasp domain-containing protein [Bacteroidota bacterium]